MREIPVEVRLREIFCAMKARPGFRIVHYSIQSNHLHLIVEVDDKDALARGMQSLSVRIARGLNKLWQRAGRVFGDRYHAVLLRKPRQVRNVIVYVLTNAWKHGLRIRAALDRFASGWCFDGYKETVTVRGTAGIERPVEEPETWLLKVGWKRHGEISVHERTAGLCPG